MAEIFVKPDKKFEKLLSAIANSTGGSSIPPVVTTDYSWDGASLQLSITDITGITPLNASDHPVIYTNIMDILFPCYKYPNPSSSYDTYVGEVLIPDDGIKLKAMIELVPLDSDPKVFDPSDSMLTPMVSPLSVTFSVEYDETEDEYIVNHAWSASDILDILSENPAVPFTISIGEKTCAALYNVDYDDDDGPVIKFKHIVVNENSITADLISANVANDEWTYTNVEYPSGK